MGYGDGVRGDSILPDWAISLAKQTGHVVRRPAPSPPHLPTIFVLAVRVLNINTGLLNLAS